MGDERELFRPWGAEFWANARQLDQPVLAVAWFRAGVSAADAAAWANLGYMPGEAAPLIADGITPEMAAATSEATTAVDGPDARAAVLRLAEDHPGLLVDPELADRLGLDET